MTIIYSTTYAYQTSQNTSFMIIYNINVFHKLAKISI